ncbi:purine-nucleoside phosphorylase [Candidatus Woesebacteria bacterium]|nr:purine-nucleoside phosphorylase [Candidatus Woesebacteria bacterium]
MTKHIFDPVAYEKRIRSIASFIKSRLPDYFVPQFALTLGSGLGQVAENITSVCKPIPYAQIPDFIETTVPGHAGNFIAGTISGIPIIGLQGRKHLYEMGMQPNPVMALREVTLPVQIVRALGAHTYVATNAAGGLNSLFQKGDLMIIRSHMGLFYPNALQGPPVMGSQQFVPQNREYNESMRKLLLEVARQTKHTKHVYQGVYAAVPGSSFETSAECQALRMLGVDAVGMSTVPEVMVATSLGMETVGISLITNVIAPDGVNATSHEEVMDSLNEQEANNRIAQIITDFFSLYKNRK